MVTFVGSAKGTNTATAPANLPGDIMVVCVTRNASATLPTIPAGFFKIGAGSTANTNSQVAGWKYCLVANDTVGTWTNATECIVAIWRPSAGNMGGVGGFIYSSGSSATASYGAVTLFDNTGNSWLAAFGQTKTQSVGISTAPATFSNTNGQDELGTGELASFDTNGGVTTSATHTVTITSGVWKTFVVEILDVAPSAAVNNMMQHNSFMYCAGISSPAGDNYLETLAEPVFSGNGAYCIVSYPSGSTPLIQDDGGNTWPVSGATPGTASADAGAGNMALQIFRLASATTQFQRITVSFGGAVTQPVTIWAGQLYNITGTVNGTASSGATPVNNNGLLSPGSFTPTNNNANGGNLIIAACSDSNINGGGSPVRFIAPPGYCINDGGIEWNQGQGNPKASMFQLQATSAATTPQFLMVNGGTETYNVVAMALSVGVQGTPKPAGLWIDRRIYYGNIVQANAMKIQVPSTGNCGLLRTFFGSGNWTATTNLDSGAASWTKIDPGAGADPVFYAQTNQTPSFNRTLSLTFAAQTGNPAQFIYDDISGAAASPIGASASNTPPSFVNTTSVTFTNVITPQAQNSIFFSFLQVGNGPTFDSSTFLLPSGVIYDLPQYDTAVYTGSIGPSSTTLTETATAWGTIVNAAPNLQAGANVTLGTCITSGTLPTFTVQPSQTAASGTIHQKNFDGDTMAYGNGASHYRNGSSLAAQTWGFGFASIPTATGNGGTFTVVEIKAAVTAAVPANTISSGLRFRRGAPGPDVSLVTPAALPSQATPVIDVPVYYTLGRFNTPQMNLLASLRQNTANDFSTPQTQPETNTNFIGKFSPPQMFVLPSLFQNPATDVRGLEDNQHFVGKMIVIPPFALPLLRQNPASDTQGPIGPQIEAQPHWIGRFMPPTNYLLQLYRQNIAADFSTAQVQPETNTNFIGKFMPPVMTLLRSLRENPATDVRGLEDNQHWIGRFAPPVMNVLRSLRENTANDTSTAQVQPETNTNFIGRFTAPTMTLLQSLRQNIAADLSSFVQPETNTHFIGKFAAPVMTLLRLMRENQASDTQGPLGVQPETNVNTIGKFSPPVMNLLASLRQNAATDFFVQLFDDPPGFIGRFVPPANRLLPSLRQNVAADTSSPTTQPETNVNFIGRFVAPVMQLLPSLRQNIAADFSSTVQPETNTHFIGRFAAPIMTLLQLYRQNPASDTQGPLPTQPSTEPHFIGRMTLKAMNLLPSLRQNPATDLPQQPDTPPHFIGRFVPPKLTSLLLYRQNIAADQSTAQVQPSTEPHFLGRFQPPVMTLLRLLRQNPATDLFKALFLNPNYIAAGLPRYMIASQPRQFIALGLPRQFTIVGISNNVSQTVDLQPPIDAVIEEETVCFDYGLILKPGATIISILSLTCVQYSSASDSVNDPSPGSRIIGSAQISVSPNSGNPNQAILQLVGTMIGGITYRLQCVVITSDGQQLSLWSHLACQTPN